MVHHCLNEDGGPKGNLMIFLLILIFGMLTYFLNRKRIFAGKEMSDEIGIFIIISGVLLFVALLFLVIMAPNSIYIERRNNINIRTQVEVIDVIKEARGADTTIVHSSFQNLELYRAKVKLKWLRAKRERERFANVIAFGMVWRLF